MGEGSGSKELTKNHTQSYVDVLKNAKGSIRQRSYINEDKEFVLPRKSNVANFKGMEPSRRFIPWYQTVFLGNCWYCRNFSHKVVNCRAYAKNDKRFHNSSKTNHVKHERSHNSFGLL